MIADEILLLSIPFITGGTIYALTIAGLYLNTKYHNNKLAQALLVLDRVALEVVKELNQTVVEGLKKAKADGKLTHDEAVQIKSQAVALILDRLEINLIKALQRSFGSVISLIITKIEAAVFNCKKQVKDSNKSDKVISASLTKMVG